MQLNWCFTSDDEFIGRMTWDITGDTKIQIRGIFVGLMSAKSPTARTEACSEADLDFVALARPTRRATGRLNCPGC
jgi:hypothetical protein